MQSSVTILGSTGSIGQSTLDVIARHPDRFRVEALTAHKNVALLFRQCQQFKPKYAVISDEKLATQLKLKLKEEKINTEVLFGADAIVQIAGDSASTIVMAAIVGAAGLLSTLSAIKAGKRVLLANKEALVMGADFFMQSVKNYNATLLPVDSEHNAIFQCLPQDFLPGKKLQGVQSIILTASGGPFRTMPIEELKNVTPMQAIKHPNWNMGAKISIDSATMMNKGLEVIEAFWLFGLPIEKIQVIIHPQSTVHSLVVFDDSSLLAQLGCPDMRIPIAYTLTWPERMTSGAKRLDLTELKRLDFEPMSLERFPCLRLAYQALNAGGTATAILNAANEIAVDAFCHGQIRFDQIATVIDAVMQKSNVTKATDLNGILAADQKAREFTTQIIKESVYC
ncbi:MAG TPA: 1-deoxy-D-xylulose-5-phosphate reductoisomerase [Coxiellaceae bacterium]|nr:MAG: 1-deoxy-D-xylulose-5-phosphate reductoisomerase [Gammaproteobacteria bacterium RIFCSPHIGHO2_12_FULL_36_30]HLB57017.1 1-deoxy-D-xylulose-5-phosphate reductoisomerase [Coxiellaceae bacterium]